MRKVIVAIALSVLMIVGLGTTSAGATVNPPLDKTTLTDNYTGCYSIQGAYNNYEFGGVYRVTTALTWTSVWGMQCNGLEVNWYLYNLDTSSYLWTGWVNWGNNVDQLINWQCNCTYIGWRITSTGNGHNHTMADTYYTNPTVICNCWRG